MIKRTAVLAALVFLVPGHAYSEGRINFRIDFNRTSVDGAYNDVGLHWQGLEVEIEKEFTKHKVVLSGFSFGVRRELFYGFTGFGATKDVHRWDEGTYLIFRMYRNFDLSSERLWSIGPSFSLLYGIPGTTLDRTIGDRAGDGYDYTHVFPMRNSDVPKLLAQTADVGSDSALFYPEAALSIRRRIAGGSVILDWIGGVRIIRFGIVDSNTQGDLFSERLTFIPSIGMRVGFKIF